MTRLGIIWPYLPAYRVPFCDRAHQRLATHGIDLRVYTGHADNAREDERSAHWHEVVPAWQPRRGPRIRLRRLPPHTDLLIVEQAVKNLESYAALAQQAIGGPAVAMWGHGRSMSTPQSPFLAAVKQWMTRRGRWFFAYTQSGADHVVAHGFPATRVTVLGNTMDTSALTEDLKAVTPSDLAEFAGHNGLTRGRTALFVGGIDAGKDIEFLLRAADDARRVDPGFVLLIAGAGELFPWLVSRVQHCDHVRALGRLEGKHLALALASADLMVIPSGIGLVAVDALTAGLPVITRRNGTHGPEADYLCDERTSLWLPADCSASDYGRGVVDLLQDSQRLFVMRENCLTDSSRHDLGQMVESFVSGVLAWRDIEVAEL